MSKQQKAELLRGPRAEFDCAECGRHVLKFETLPEPGILLCAECVFYPGWFRDPTLRFVLDPWGLINPPLHELVPVEPGDEIIM